MPKSITQLKNKHQGEDIYVVASGASLNYFPMDYFDNKITIAVNLMYKYLKNTTYNVHKHYESTIEAIEAGQNVVTSEYDCGDRTRLNDFKDKDYYTFKHFPNGHKVVVTIPIDIDNDMIIVSFSTITSAIHLAYYMGAKNIILAGHDCGNIDGQSNISTYYPETFKVPSNLPYSTFNDQTVTLVEEIRRKNVNVFSLNPFVNFHLEGHKLS
jgi:hypothetical protein